MFTRFFLLMLFSFALNGASISYQNGSRFGDCLIAYLHAKWLSYQYDLPLVYKPFHYSSELAMDEKEGRQAKGPLVPLRHMLQIQKTTPFVYEVPYFPESPTESGTLFHVDWKDSKFRKMAREMIAPKRPLQIVRPPVEMVSIAIHIRDGGSYVHDFDVKEKWPYKAPPLEFYLEGFQKIVKLYEGRPIYCHLFTDAEEPAQLAESFRQLAPHVTFGFRESGNHHDQNVLEDFFSLFEFDILIRPESNFSMVPSLLHDYEIVYSPISVH